MKILVKSLAGGNFHVDAEPTDTIGSIKNKINLQQGHPAELQKIIFSGKVLTDDKTVADCNIKEKDFLVIMVAKAKPAKPASSSAPPAKEDSTAATAAAATTATSSPSSSSSPTSSSSSSSPQDALPTPAPKTEEKPTAEPTPTPSAEASNGPASSSGSFLVGSQLESAVQNIVEMGFDKEQVQKAMRAAFNNPDRAVEYLMTGIPEHLNQPQQPPAAAAAAAPTSESSAPAPQALAAATAGSAPTSNPRVGNLFEAAAAQAQGGGGGRTGTGAGVGRGVGGELPGEDDGHGNQVIDLGNPAMLAQLQQLVQQNPAALQPLVQAIAQSNPQLAEALNQDPQGVLSLLAGGAAEGAGEEMDLPTMQELSTEDRAAVEQIVAMGIPESKAIESYFMCGKNVEMAVQYYFENPQDFDD